jgi:hypothetical protein
MDGIKQFWNTGVGKVLIIGILGSVFLVSVLLGITLLNGNAPANTSETEDDLASAIQTQKASETEAASQPTDMVSATETSPPTETPFSDTPMPTSSPVSTGTVASASNPYLDQVNVNLQAYQNALANANDYVQTPSTDISVLLNEDWKQNAENALNQLDEAATQLESMDNPPPEQEQLDMYLKSIASETHEMVDNYGMGMDQLDPSAIASAVNNLTNISSYVNDATTELEKYYNP